METKQIDVDEGVQCRVEDIIFSAVRVSPLVPGDFTCDLSVIFWPNDVLALFVLLFTKPKIVQFWEAVIWCTGTLFQKRFPCPSDINIMNLPLPH